MHSFIVKTVLCIFMFLEICVPVERNALVRYLIWVLFAEALINKSNGLSKQTSADDASDDEDGDDVEQDIEGSADHPGDY
jgi:hypothetical protein